MTPDNFELDWLKRWALYSPNKIALREGESDRAYSYQSLFDRSTKMAFYLNDQYGIKANDRVVAVCKNDVDYIALFFACHRLGATLVPVNFRFKSMEIEFIVNDSEPTLAIYDLEFEKSFEHVNKSIKKISFESFIKDIDQVSSSFLDFLATAEMPALILYTSGTTGFPKGAVLSHRMLFWNSINTSLRLNITSADKTVIFLPLFHTGGWNVLTTPFFHHGAEIILIKKFEPELVLSLCEKFKTTILFGVPTTMDMLARSNRFSSTELKSIRYAIVGGEPMPLELINVWEARSIPIRQGYGLTEFGPNVFSLNEEDSKRKIGSIGFPNFYIQCRVVDGHNIDCKAHEVGELLLKGPMLMTGYWKNKKATDETIKDGWLYTGDLVKKDDEGYFYVVGRKKEMFISGGENVYPAEIERVLRTLPGIREAAVVGIKDAKWGEVGSAFVSLEKEGLLDADKIQQHCLKHLAKFKVPKEFHILKDLPKSDSGKILKRSLTQ